MIKFNDYNYHTVYLQHDYQISVHSLTRHAMHQSL